ncbi:MAG: riboflavin kinase [Oscillospiraceae bacterium]
MAFRVSSTYIRPHILETGDMETAVKFLEHPQDPQWLRGSRTPAGGGGWGIPTANLRLPEGLAEPKFGVYACRAVVEGKR